MKRSLLILLVFWTFFVQSCRTAKKDWVNENFTSKSETEAFQKGVFKATENLQKAITETKTELKKEISESKESKEVSNETENTTVTVDITAEDGKEKSATVGGTTVTSKGANISVTTTSSKETSKETIEKISLLESKVESFSLVIEERNNRIEQLENYIYSYVQSQESQSSIFKKTVKVFGATLPVWILVIVILIILGAFWFIKKKIKNPFI